MNPQLERLFHSVRRGIESNVKSALRSMEVTRRKDIQALRDRIDIIRKNELVMVRKKLDRIVKSLGRVEAFKPYLSAIEAATRSSKKREAAKPKRRRKVAKRKKVKTRKKTAARRGKKRATPRAKRSRRRS